MAAVLVGVLLGLSGCGTPPAGTDGNLLDDWQPMTGAEVRPAERRDVPGQPVEVIVRPGVRAGWTTDPR
jgi:hypothetical protein